MRVILDSVSKKDVAGSIKVEYPHLSTESDQNEEYDEDEQLYSALNREANSRKYHAADIPIYVMGPEGAGLALVVPHFTNPIAEKLVAAEIAKLAPRRSNWIVLAPCVLNNGTSLCRLDLGTQFDHVPRLQPPHFITGIGGAVVSELAKLNGLEHCNVLVLNAEGHPGYEKIDADSIMDAVEVIGTNLVGKLVKSDYIKKMSQSVRKINSAATSGMYI